MSVGAEAGAIQATTGKALLEGEGGDDVEGVAVDEDGTDGLLLAMSLEDVTSAGAVDGEAVPVASVAGGLTCRDVKAEEAVFADELIGIAVPDCVEEGSADATFELGAVLARDVLGATSASPVLRVSAVVCDEEFDAVCVEP